jgi:hypothetical protein
MCCHRGWRRKQAHPCFGTRKTLGGRDVGALWYTTPQHFSTSDDPVFVLIHLYH